MEWILLLVAHVTNENQSNELLGAGDVGTGHDDDSGARNHSSCGFGPHGLDFNIYSVGSFHVDAGAGAVLWRVGARQKYSLGDGAVRGHWLHGLAALGRVCLQFGF